MRKLFKVFKQLGLFFWGLRHYVPFTPLGLIVGGGGAWLSFSYGPDKFDRVLYAAGLVTLGVLALSLVSVVVGSVLVYLAARRAHLEAEFQLQTGGTLATGVRLPCLSWWPLISLEVRWEDPADVEVELRRQGGRCRELVTPRSRGEVRSVRRRLLVGDIFGFCVLGLRHTAPTALRVSPPPAQVTAHVLSRFLGGENLSHPSGTAEGEMIEMRRYSHGDPLRFILWKAFARTRKLLVRVPEQAITPRPSAAGYLVAGPGDEPTASAARHFIEGGLLGEDFTFCADGADKPTADADEALEQIILSVGQRGRGAAGLGQFMDNLDRTRRENCVLFVPPTPGPWLRRLEHAARRVPGARVVTAVDDRPYLEPQGRLSRLLFSSRGTQRAAHFQLLQVAARLTDMGLQVNVLHRPSGELLNKAQLELARAGAGGGRP